MTSPRRVILLLLSLCLLGACVQFEQVATPGQDDGIGGTGIFANTDGIGGTGHRGDPDTDGIGGTGLWANIAGSGDVALYGVVTALETLVVNGHGMYLPEDSEFLLNGQPEKVAALSIGQVVAVRAGLVNGVITAKAIHADDTVIGPIESLAVDGASLQVLGQRVALGSHTRINIDSDDGGHTELRVGDVIRISGLRRLDGSIEASLVQLAAPTQSYSVAGWVVPAGENGFAIGDLKLPRAMLSVSSGAAQRLVVTGDIRGGEFSVEKVSMRPALPFAGEVDYWSIQGYAVRQLNTRQIRFSGYRGTLRGGQDLESGFTDERRVIMGIRSDGTETPAINRVRPSPLRHPDSSMTIPHYSPGLVQPEVVFAPTVRVPKPDPGSDITIPQQRPGVDRQTIGAPRQPRVLTARPSVPRPVPPAVDIKPRPTTLPPITDSLPSGG